MIKSSINIKFNFFDEISEEDLKLSLRYNSSHILGFLLLTYVMCWRAQIAHSQTADSISRKDLQGTPSMRYIAKLFSKAEPLRWLLAAVTVSKTSLFDTNDYIQTPLVEKDSFVAKRIQDAACITGPSKMLSHRQVGSYDELLTHRRGIMAKLRGTFQAFTLYSPEKVIKGINISYLTWSQFVDVFTNTMRDYNINEEQLIKNFAEAYPDLASEYGDMKSLCALMLEYYINPERGTLVFDDGIIVSSDDDNLTPLEKAFSIKRKKPAIIPDIKVTPDKDDIFLTTSLKQLEQVKKLKQTKLAKKRRTKTDKQT